MPGTRVHLTCAVGGILLVVLVALMVSARLPGGGAYVPPSPDRSLVPGGGDEYASPGGLPHTVAGSRQESRNLSFFPVTQTGPASPEETYFPRTGTAYGNPWNSSLSTTPFVVNRSSLDPIAAFPGVTIWKALHPDRERERGINLTLSGDIAWVMISAGAGTPPHILKGTTEAVYITGGEAFVQANGSTVKAVQGEAVLIPAGTVQSIRNTGSDPLVYISILVPPYNESREVILDRSGSGSFPSDPVPLLRWEPSMSTRNIYFDRLALSQIYHPLAGEHEGLRAPLPSSWSYVTIPEGGGSLPHTLTVPAEVITVLGGSATAGCGGMTFHIREGDCLYIPPGTVQSIRNTGSGTLTYLTLVDPYWRPDYDLLLEERSPSPSGAL